jgi:hypothetical protein
MAGPSIVLDLRFRVISPSQRIYIVFPGQGYFLYDQFVTQGRIFPELPALDLLPGKPIEQQPDLEKRVARSRRIANWYASKKEGDRPSRILSDYHVRRTRAFSQVMGVLTGFFGRAKRGDLVIVPPASVFERVLIGELLDDPTEFDLTTVPDFWDNEKVPSRKARWLAYPLRGELSLDLQQRFPSPNAFRELDRQARAEIYSLAYGSYSIEDSFTSKFDVTSADFSVRDDYHLQQFFNVVAAISQQIEAKRANDLATTSLNAKSLDEIIDLLTNDAYVPGLSVNINSPGSLVLSCAKVVTLVAAGVLALSVLDADDTWKAVAQGSVVIQNSETPDPNNKCNAQVSAEVLEQLKLMGIERWKELCKKALQLLTSTGLNGKSKANKK